MSLLGWTVLAICLYVGWLIYLTYQHRKEPRTSSNEYYLAGRNVKRGSGLLTFFASYFSAGTVIGAVGYFYGHGIGTLVFAVPAYVLMGYLVLTAGRRLWERSRKNPEIRSPIQLIFRPYRTIPTVEWIAVLLMFLFLIPYLALQITALSRLLNAMFGVEYTVAAVGTLAIILLYTDLGGLKSVIKSDSFQAIITLVGFTFVAVYFVGDGWSFEPAEFVSDVRGVEEGALLGLPGPNGFYTASTLFIFALAFGAVTISQPQLVKRVMVVRERKFLRTMGYWFPVLGVVLIVLTGFLGLGGAVLYPGIESGDMVVGEILAHVPGILGAFTLIGIVAATMSTGDSLLLVFGLMLSEQLGLESDGKRLLVGRWSAVLITVLALIASLDPPQLVADLSVLSFTGTIQMVPAFLVGIYGIRCSGFWLSWSMVGGCGTVAVLNWGVSGSPPLGLHAAIWGLLVATVIVLIGVLSASGSWNKQSANQTGQN